MKRYDSSNEFSLWTSKHWLRLMLKVLNVSAFLCTRSSYVFFFMLLIILSMPPNRIGFSEKWTKTQAEQSLSIAVQNVRLRKQRTKITQTKSTERTKSKWKYSTNNNKQYFWCLRNDAPQRNTAFTSYTERIEMFNATKSIPRIPCKSGPRKKKHYNNMHIVERCEIKSHSMFGWAQIERRWEWENKESWQINDERNARKKVVLMNKTNQNLNKRGTYCAYAQKWIKNEANTKNKHARMNV